MSYNYRVSYTLNGESQLTGLLPFKYIQHTIEMLQNQGAVDISYHKDNQ